MGWQAEVGLPFALAGGAAIVPANSSLRVGPANAVSQVLGLLSPNVQAPIGAPPNTNDIPSIRATLDRWKVNVIVIPFSVPKGRAAAAFFTAVTGELPAIQNHSWVWYGVRKTGSIAVPANAFELCGAVKNTDPPLLGPECILSVASRSTSGAGL
jgi:hypothetical protein